MSQNDPVSVWLEEVKHGDDSAVRLLWEHFVGRLYVAARQKLQPATRRAYDEEDAAQSAFHSLCAGIQAGRFPNLNDRHSLWRMLLVITSRKVSHRHRYERQERRDVRRTEFDTVFKFGQTSREHVLDGLESREPTPEYTAEFVETLGCLFDILDDEKLQTVGRLKIEGFSDAEIATELNCSRRTVQRKLEIIRRMWQRQMQDA